MTDWFGIFSLLVCLRHCNRSSWLLDPPLLKLIPNLNWRACRTSPRNQLIYSGLDSMNWRHY
jgi:hypothetical protein